MRMCLTMLTAGLLAAAAIPGPATADGLPGYQDEGPVYRAETYRPRRESTSEKPTRMNASTAEQSRRGWWLHQPQRFRHSSARCRPSRC